MKQYELNAFGHVSSLAGNTSNKSTSFFLPPHGNEATFSCFSTFQTFSYSISKNIQANPCGFIRDKKRATKQMYKVSIKYMEQDGRNNDLK